MLQLERRSLMDARVASRYRLDAAQKPGQDSSQAAQAAALAETNGHIQ